MSHWPSEDRKAYYHIDIPRQLSGSFWRLMADYFEFIDHFTLILDAGNKSQQTLEIPLDEIEEGLDQAEENTEAKLGSPLTASAPPEKGICRNAGALVRWCLQTWKTTPGSTRGNNVSGATKKMASLMQAES